MSRLKIMASLDIAERRKPQDGKIKFKIGENKEIELRVATIPTAGYNEDVVMRILAASEPLPVDKMGFSDWNLREIKNIAQKPHGIILCVGPTGSGKPPRCTPSPGTSTPRTSKSGRRRTRSKSQYGSRQAGSCENRIHLRGRHARLSSAPTRTSSWSENAKRKRRIPGSKPR